MTFLLNLKLIITLLALAVVSVPITEAAMDTRFELDPARLSGTTKPAAKSENRTKMSGDGKTPSLSGKPGIIHTIKSGDYLSRILINEYGLSSHEAKSYIKEIIDGNNIRDVKRLRIGQKIVIPKIYRRTDGSLKQVLPKQAAPRISGVVETSNQFFSLETSLPNFSEQELVGKIRDTWNRIVPSNPEQMKPVAVQTSTFTLALDINRYPTFSAMDGGRMLLDLGDTIPPLVKALINEKEPSLRVVSGSSLGTKNFLSSILEAGGFYSVEENFSMDFGADPKLSFISDFKIEKTPESLIKQDIVLINSGLSATPPALGEFLKKEGFSLYEPFASLRAYTVRNLRPIHQITTKKQPEIIDAILRAFSISSDRGRRLDVFAADNNGISLTVKAERYFERGGQRFVITSFDGDPVNFTLFRILETKGYRVVILEEHDDFRRVSEKILSSMKIHGNYAKHNLLRNSAAYSLHMSGFNLDNVDFPGGLFMTNLEMDPIIRDLLTENGYNITSR